MSRGKQVTQHSSIGPGLLSQVPLIDSALAVVDP